jgi:putative ABC transport system permease protein
VYHDYSTDAGVLMMDQRLYRRLTGSDRVESVALYLEPGASESAVRRAVEASAGDSLQLVVLPNRTLRARVLTVFDQTFQITWALQVVAVVVAVLGVVGTLTALVVLRGREIGMLRAAGATRRQVRTMVLTESALLGLAGATAGCAAGVLMALVLVHVINQEFFGWTIRTAIDPLVFVQALGLMLATSLLAGLGPARLAAGRSPADAMRAE